MKKNSLKIYVLLSVVYFALGVFPKTLKAVSISKAKTLIKKNSHTSSSYAEKQKKESQKNKENPSFTIEKVSKNALQIFLKKQPVDQSTSFRQSVDSAFVLTSSQSSHQACSDEMSFPIPRQKTQKTTHFNTSTASNHIHNTDALWKNQFSISEHLALHNFCSCPSSVSHLPFSHDDHPIDHLLTVSLPIGWNLVQFSTDSYPAPFCFEEKCRSMLSPSSLISVNFLPCQQEPDSKTSLMDDASLFLPISSASSIVVAKKIAFLDQQKVNLKNLEGFILPPAPSLHSLSFVYPDFCFQQFIVPENQTPGLRFFHLLYSNARRCILQRQGAKKSIKKILIAHNPHLEHLTLDQTYIQQLVLMNNPKLKTLFCPSLQKIDHLMIQGHQLHQTQILHLWHLTTHSPTNYFTLDNDNIFFNQGSLLWKNVFSITLSESEEKDVVLFEYSQKKHLPSKRKLRTNIMQLNISHMPILQSLTVFGDCHNLLSLNIENCPQLNLIQITHTTLMKVSIQNVSDKCVLKMQQNPFLFDFLFQTTSNPQSTVCKQSDFSKELIL